MTLIDHDTLQMMDQNSFDPQNIVEHLGFVPDIFDFLKTKEDVFAAAVRIALNPDVEGEVVEQELETLVKTAQSNGIEISIDELRDRIEEREEEGPNLTSYSWVHLNEFRLFELHDRCIPWADPDDLRTAVEKIP